MYSAWWSWEHVYLCVVFHWVFGKIHVCAWLSLINWLNWLVENFYCSECLDTDFYLLTGIQPLLQGGIWIQNDKTRSWFSARNQVHDCCFIRYYFDLHLFTFCHSVCCHSFGTRWIIYLRYLQHVVSLERTLLFVAFVVVLFNSIQGCKLWNIFIPFKGVVSL